MPSTSQRFEILGASCRMLQTCGLLPNAKLIPTLPRLRLKRAIQVSAHSLHFGGADYSFQEIQNILKQEAQLPPDKQDQWEAACVFYAIHRLNHLLSHWSAIQFSEVRRKEVLEILEEFVLNPREINFPQEMHLQAQLEGLRKNFRPFFFSPNSWLGQVSQQLESTSSSNFTNTLPEGVTVQDRTLLIEGMPLSRVQAILDHIEQAPLGFAWLYQLYYWFKGIRNLAHKGSLCQKVLTILTLEQLHKDRSIRKFCEEAPEENFLTHGASAHLQPICKESLMQKIVPQTEFSPSWQPKFQELLNRSNELTNLRCAMEAIYDAGESICLSQLGSLYENLFELNPSPIKRRTKRFKKILAQDRACLPRNFKEFKIKLNHYRSYLAQAQAKILERFEDLLIGDTLSESEEVLKDEFLELIVQMIGDANYRVAQALEREITKALEPLEDLKFSDVSSSFESLLYGVGLLKAFNEILGKRVKRELFAFLFCETRPWDAAVRASYPEKYSSNFHARWTGEVFFELAFHPVFQAWYQLQVKLVQSPQALSKLVLHQLNQQSHLISFRKGYCQSKVSHENYHLIKPMMLRNAFDRLLSMTATARYVHALRGMEVPPEIQALNQQGEAALLEAYPRALRLMGFEGENLLEEVLAVFAEDTLIEEPQPVGVRFKGDKARYLNMVIYDTYVDIFYKMLDINNDLTWKNLDEKYNHGLKKCQQEIERYFSDLKWPGWIKEQIWRYIEGGIDSWREGQREYKIKEYVEQEKEKRERAEGLPFTEFATRYLMNEYRVSKPEIMDAFIEFSRINKWQGRLLLKRFSEFLDELKPGVCQRIGERKIALVYGQFLKTGEINLKDNGNQVARNFQALYEYYKHGGPDKLSEMEALRTIHPLFRLAMALDSFAYDLGMFLKTLYEKGQNRVILTEQELFGQKQIEWEPRKEVATVPKEVSMALVLYRPRIINPDREEDLFAQFQV